MEGKTDNTGGLGFEGRLVALLSDLFGKESIHAYKSSILLYVGDRRVDIQPCADSAVVRCCLLDDNGDKVDVPRNSVEALAVLMSGARFKPGVYRSASGGCVPHFTFGIQENDLDHPDAVRIIIENLCTMCRDASSYYLDAVSSSIQSSNCPCEEQFEGETDGIKAFSKTADKTHCTSEDYLRISAELNTVMKRYLYRRYLAGKSDGWNAYIAPFINPSDTKRFDSMGSDEARLNALGFRQTVMILLRGRRTSSASSILNKDLMSLLETSLDDYNKYIVHGTSAEIPGEAVQRLIRIGCRFDPAFNNGQPYGTMIEEGSENKHDAEYRGDHDDAL